MEEEEIGEIKFEKQTEATCKPKPVKVEQRTVIATSPKKNPEEEVDSSIPVYAFDCKKNANELPVESPWKYVPPPVKKQESEVEKPNTMYYLNGRALSRPVNVSSGRKGYDNNIKIEALSSLIRDNEDYDLN